MNWPHPPLTVAVQTHNRSAFLQEALASVLGQTWGDFELLVLDNASSDHTADVVQGMKDSRLAYLRQPPGHLSGYNWAQAVWMARGEHLLVAHDDDVLEPTLLARAMETLRQDPCLAAVASNASLMDATGKPLQPRLYPWDEDRVFAKGAYWRAFLEEKLWVPMQACVFRREALARPLGLWGRWRPAPRLATLGTGDILNALQLNLAGGFRMLAEPLFRYRQHGDQEGRGIDPSAHMVDLLRRLRPMVRSREALRECRVPLEARLARYRAQDLVLRAPAVRSETWLARQVGALSADLRHRLAPDEAAHALVTPVALLDRLLGRPGWPGDPSPAGDAATRAFAAWHARLEDGGAGLFPKRCPTRKVAILGSLFVAGLLALDARRAGWEVAALVDSSPVRHGAHLLGHPIHPPRWLQDHGRALDAIVLSSEGDSEEGIRAMLAGLLGDSAPPVVSWKELALGQALLPGGRS